MSIIHECMIVNLQIGMWVGYRLDKDASKTVTDMAHADDDAARVNKHIIPKSALAPITKAAASIRTHFYAKTLPWKDNGDRLLTRKMYMSFIQRHEQLVDEFNRAVEHFIATDYPAAIQQAEFRMGDLFRPDDYPEAHGLQRKFYVNMDVDPVTDATDVRVRLSSIGEAQLAQRVADAEAAMQSRINKAISDVWARIDDVVGHFATKMKEEDGLFRNSTVEKLHDLASLLPDLNIANDPALDRICNEITSKLTIYDAKDLRQHPEVRQAAANDAAQIMADMAGFMKAFSSAA